MVYILSLGLAHIYSDDGIENSIWHKKFDNEKELAQFIVHKCEKKYGYIDEYLLDTYVDIEETNKEFNERYKKFKNQNTREIDTKEKAIIYFESFSDFFVETASGCSDYSIFCPTHLNIIDL